MSSRLNGTLVKKSLIMAKKGLVDFLNKILLF